MYDPIDGSDPAQAAAETAVQLVDTLGAEVALLAVLESSNHALTESLPGDPGRDDLAPQWRGALDRAADAAVNAGVSCHTAIDSGAVHEAIDYVDWIDADLVSMGTHGRSDLDRRGHSVPLLEFD
jgi:nucleotide-binding universal stress UspA family protein